MGMTAVAVFGGSGVANQISELKRGTEVRGAFGARTWFAFICLVPAGEGGAEVGRAFCLRPRSKANQVGNA